MKEEDKTLGRNSCMLCATPDVRIEDGYQFCWGCGWVCLHDLALYMRRKHTPITLDRATRKYESQKSLASFGSWLLSHDFELTTKP